MLLPRLEKKHKQLTSIQVLRTCFYVNTLYVAMSYLRGGWATALWVYYGRSAFLAACGIVFMVLGRFKPKLAALKSTSWFSFGMLGVTLSSLLCKREKVAVTQNLFAFSVGGHLALALQLGFVINLFSAGVQKFTKLSIVKKESLDELKDFLRELSSIAFLFFGLWLFLCSWCFFGHPPLGKK